MTTIEVAMSLIGDMFFNKYLGVTELKAIQLLGCYAMAEGNHEFDLTPAVQYQCGDFRTYNAGHESLVASCTSLCRRRLRRNRCEHNRTAE